MQVSNQRSVSPTVPRLSSQPEATESLRRSVDAARPVSTESAHAHSRCCIWNARVDGRSRGEEEGEREGGFSAL